MAAVFVRESGVEVNCMEYVTSVDTLQVRVAVACARFFCVEAMSSDSQAVQHYVGRFDGTQSDDFHIVTSASLEGSEVQMWAGPQDKGPVYTHGCRSVRGLAKFRSSGKAISCSS